MANRHYAEIGDVWKHLPLAEILSIEKPEAYWESHAGSSHYPLTHSPSRDYGVFHFLASAQAVSVLEQSRYAGWLARHAQNGVYAGSPLIAMEQLGSAAAFLFCDVDRNSLATIRDDASELGIDTVATVEGDGVMALAERTESLPHSEARTTFIHIDPYDPFASGDSGLTSVDLFCRAIGQGAKAMLWYGFDSMERQGQLTGRMAESFRTWDLDPTAHGLWRGEIVLDAIECPDRTFSPGVLGCGILCGNLGEASLGRCRDLGKALETVYASATLPGGQTGAIAFRTEPCAQVSRNPTASCRGL